MSAIINSLLVAFVALAMLRFFKYLPLSTVASIVVVVAIRLVETHHIKRMWHIDRQTFWLTMLVALLVVIVDPTFGIVVGAVIALLLFVRVLSRGRGQVVLRKGHRTMSSANLSEFDKATAPVKQSLSDLLRGEMSNMAAAESMVEVDSKILEHSNVSDTVVYRIHGELTYFNSLAHEERMEQIRPSTRYVVFSMKHLHFLDMDGLDNLAALREQLMHRKVTVMIAQVNSMVLPMLEKADYFMDMRKDGLVFQHVSDALTRIEELETHEAQAATENG